VNQAKLGRDLAEAIWVAPNNAARFAAVTAQRVQVQEGILADGVGEHLAGRFPVAGAAGVEQVARHLAETGTQILVNFLPVGSQLASEHYAEAALRAGCGYVNCIPATLARSPQWLRRFAEAGLPLLGDDLTSQFGSTLVHHALLQALLTNGVTLNSTYQLNTGGNMDFLNMQDRDRMESKQDSKAQGMLAGSRSDLSLERVHVGAEYMPLLADRKVAFIRVEGIGFGGTLVEVDLRLSIEDSPSGAGNTLDAVRYARYAMDRGRPQLAEPASALLMKAPPVPMSEAEAVGRLREQGAWQDE
jgi:myo-inositol-1-phosphate synthase